MMLKNVPLAPRTTLGVGGAARFFIEAHTEKDIEEAITYARGNVLPLFVLGAGSNVLVPDEGVDGVVLKMALGNIAVEEERDDVLFVADAGTLWEDLVNKAGARGTFGIENLAGIPGSVGGAAVQNIGAYGAELAGVFDYAEGVDRATGLPWRITRDEAGFGYRTSLFKVHRNLLIVRVALRLTKNAARNVAYADLARASAEGVPLATPEEIASAVRAIRARKFPHAAGEGTAGSFFKNPVVSREVFEGLQRRFPEIPAFVQEDGTIKLPLAWILDRALALKGFSKGRARLYEQQPLVIVASAGASAADVGALAAEVAERVLAATGITIEREVEIFGAQN
ncbi:UDP-N-acetylmuramate dehydrogenase [Candidatus Kaiserbacteria bacterium]|nr:UDP-N-acetylmuramate dehydrogenase [Candidatus Kaiserbacteria bacterium]